MLNTLFNRLVAGAPSDDHGPAAARRGEVERVPLSATIEHLHDRWGKTLAMLADEPKDPPAPDFGDVPPDPGLTPTEPPAPDFGDTPPDPGAIEPEPEPARLKKPEPPTREQRHLAAMHSAESEAWDRELERRSAPDVVPEC